ncbi:MAG TPA: tRNA lysidine(34) synthetase TilS [Steroidobacteraceae bacterium]|jgi:tRNA(Ile)-lysidine synthase|nr:tRNA lysidine(34) synthetase TilS [Steroidobacteraceae bacterium]
MARVRRRPPGFGPRWLEERLAQLLPQFPHVRLCVAFSGGVDSTALLAALARLRRSPLKLRALHVDHGLQPRSASWSAHCRRIAKSLGVPLSVRRVPVLRRRGESLEAAARELRYRLCGEALGPGEALLTAHHQDDQLETLLLQLLRGAGIAGLAAMPEVAPLGRGLLVRPLLPLSRRQLADWVSARRLTYVEDDSNALLQLDRNYLRLRVLPLIRERWPAAAATVARAARHAAEAQRLLDAQGAADVARARWGDELAAWTLRALPADRRRNALRFWIAQHGVQAPAASRLTEMAGPLLAARSDAQPFVAWGAARVQRQGDLLYLQEQRETLAAPAAVAWRWRGQPACRLPGVGGTLALQRDGHGPLDLDRLPPRLLLRPRRGGERLRPVRGGPRRALKSLLQEAGVPPAQRRDLPLVFAGEQLIAAADLWLDESVQAGPASRRRARLRWTAAR